MRLYPRDFRRHYAADLLAYLYLDRRRSGHPPRSWRAVRFWLAAYADVIGAATRQRAERTRRRASALPDILAIDLVQAGRFLTRGRAGAVAELVGLTFLLTVAVVWIVTWQGHFVGSGAATVEGQLAFVTMRAREGGAWRTYTDGGHFSRWQEHFDPETLAGFVPGAMIVRIGNRGAAVPGARVTPGLPTLLGIGCGPGARSKGPRGALVDPSLLSDMGAGQGPVLPDEILVNGEPVAVAGKIPATYAGIGAGRVWLMDGRSPRVDTPMTVLVRGSEQLDLDQIEHRLRAIATAGDGAWQPALTKMAELQGPAVRTAALWVLLQLAFSTVSLFAGIVSATLGSTESGKDGVRLQSALGASTGRLVRQRALAGLLMGIAATSIAVAVILSTRPYWRNALPTDLPGFPLDESSVLASGLGAGLLVAAAIGVAYASPVLLTRRIEGPTNRRPFPGCRLRPLAVLTVGLAVVSLALPIVPATRVLQLELENPGFDAATVQVWRAEAAEELSPPPAGLLEERLTRLLGPDGWTLSSHTPVADGEPVTVNVGAASVEAGRIAVTPPYFRVLGIPVLDGGGELRSGVAVNRTLAAALWGASRAVGRTLRLGERDLRVSAVVDTPAAAGPRAYVPAGGGGARWTYVIARTHVDPEDVARRVSGDGREVVLLPLGNGHDLMRDRPAYRVAGRSLAVLSVMAGLLLAGTAYQLLWTLRRLARSRRREIALRIALGGRPRPVHSAALRPVAQVVTLGIAVGVLGSWPLVRIGTSLFQVATVVVPVSIVCGALAVAATAAAGIHTTIRDSSVQPARLLRFP